MTPLPLHPAIVHLPLGLAAVLPLVALAMAVLLWRRRIPQRAFAGVVALQLVVLAGGLAARAAGEQEEDRVEAVVPEAALERHEEAADVFLIGAGVAAAVSAAAVFVPASAAIPVAAAAVLASAAVTGLAVRVGEAGGELVYRHGAASAYTGAAPLAGAPEGARDDD